MSPIAKFILDAVLWTALVYTLVSLTHDAWQFLQTSGETLRRKPRPLSRSGSVRVVHGFSSTTNFYDQESCND